MSTRGKRSTMWKPGSWQGRAIRTVRVFVLATLIIGGLARIGVLDPYLGVAIGGLAAGLGAGRDRVVAGVGAGLAGLVACALLAAGDAKPPVLLASLAVVILAGLGGTMLSRAVEPKHVAFALVGLMVVCLLAGSATSVRRWADYFSGEPALESYRFDTVFFVKTMHLVDDGVGFYEAYGSAFAGDERFDEPTQDLAGWRSPTLFWLWSALFSDGANMAHTFILLAAAAMVGAYYIALRVGSPVDALAAPALLAGWYAGAFHPLPWFPELEYWAGFFAIASAILMYAKREKVGLALAVVSGAIREWLLSVVIAGAVHLLAGKRVRKALPWIGALALLVVAYVANAALVREYLLNVGIEPRLGASGRVGGGGLGFLLYSLSFAADHFLHSRVIPYAACAIAFLGVYARFRKKDYFLPALMLVPMAFFMVFGSGRGPGDPTGWNDYYSASFLPFAFVLTGPALRFIGELGGTER